MTQPPAAERRGVTLRAVLVGVVCCLVIAIGEPFGVLVVLGSPLAADFSTGYALVLLLLLVLLANPLVGVVTGWRLQRGELITVFIMMIIAAAIPSWGFMMNLMPLIGGFFYFATPENQWATVILPYLPEAMQARRAERGLGAVRGQRQGPARAVDDLAAAAGAVVCVHRQHLLHHALRTRHPAASVGGERAAVVSTGRVAAGVD